MKIESSRMDDIERKQIGWCGHMQRMDGNRFPKQCERCNRCESERKKDQENGGTEGDK